MFGRALAWETVKANWAILDKRYGVGGSGIGGIIVSRVTESICPFVFSYLPCPPPTDFHSGFIHDASVLGGCHKLLCHSSCSNCHDSPCIGSRECRHTHRLGTVGPQRDLRMATSEPTRKCPSIFSMKALASVDSSRHRLGCTAEWHWHDFQPQVMTTPRMTTNCSAKRSGCSVRRGLQNS